jgi:hypothetical protein
MKRARTFLADFPTKGVQTIVLRNCQSKAEAKRKLMGFYAGTLSEIDEKDVEFLNAEVTDSFPGRAKIVEDKSS